MSFKPALEISDFTGGINTRQRPNKIAPNQARSIVSMDFYANSMRRAKGYETFGTESEPDLTGKTLYKHSVLAGQDVLIKTIGTHIKFYDPVDEVWYNITTSTFTSDLRWSFASFNGYLYGNNGTDSWVFWKGSVRSTLNGAILAGATTIDLAVGEGSRFPASGSILIQDDEIAYTGVSGDQLTGVTGVDTGHANGSTVVFKLDSSSYSSLSKANQIVFHQNRLYMIDKLVPTVIRHSKLADNTNPETDLVNFTVAGSGAGDAGFGIAPEEVVSIKQMINGNSSVVLAAFCKDGTAYAFSVVDSSGGTTTNSFIPIRTMNAYPQAKQMVTIAENDVALTDQLGHIRTLGYGDVNTPLQVQTISQQIEPSLELVDFTNGCMAYFKRKLYAVGTSSGLTSPDIAFYHDSNYNSWGSFGHWDVIDLAIYNDELYGLSAITGNVYKLETGYNANGGTYYSEYYTGDFTWGFPHQLKSALKMRLSGFITSNCTAYIDFFFDNASVPVTFEINGDNTDIIGNSINVAVGTVVFGPSVVGGGIPGGSSRKEFYAELRLNEIPHFVKMAMRIRIDDQEVDFELNDATIFAKLEGENAWLQSKVLNRS